MANVINLPTYEQVDNISSVVNQTSGVIMGVDDKKYKAVFSEGYRVSEIMKNAIDSPEPFVILDSLIVSISIGNIYIYDKVTLERIANVTRYSSDYDYRLHGSGIIHNITEDDEYLYIPIIKLSNSLYYLEVISKTTWSRVSIPKPIGLPTNSELRLSVSPDRFYVILIGVPNNTSLGYVSKSSATSATSSMTLTYRGASTTGRFIASVVEIGDYIYVREKTGSSLSSWFLKYDKSFNLIAQSSQFNLFNTSNAEYDVFFNYSNNVITFLNTANAHIELNTQTMAVGITRGYGAGTIPFYYDAQTKETYAPLSSYEDYYFCKYTNNTDANNTAKPTSVYKIVAPIERNHQARAAFKYHFADGNFYLHDNINLYNSYKLEKTNLIVGYEEVI